MVLQCLIIEDEPLAAELLSDYIGQIPFLAVASQCTDALKGMDVLKSQPIDVIFLDLHLPGIKGFDFLKTLQRRPQVIITTAYQQYALQGYEFHVTDYLVKPIEFSRFLAAVNKLQVSTANALPAEAEVSSRPYIFVYADKRKVKIFTADILFAESERDYLKIVTKEKTIVVRQTMQEFEKQLSTGNFMRVHRSFLVNLDLVEAFDSGQLEVAGKTIPVGRQYRNEVMKKLDQ